MDHDSRYALTEGRTIFQEVYLNNESAGLPDIR